MMARQLVARSMDARPCTVIATEHHGSQHPLTQPRTDAPPEPGSTGSVVDRRTVWRPSILTDMFWSVVNLIVAL